MNSANYGAPGTLADGALTYPEVDRRSGLSVNEFKRDYRSAGRPVVILDTIDDWRARSAWSLEFFKSRYGDRPVLVYKYRGEKYRQGDSRRMLLGDYIDGVLQGDWESFPYYIRDNWSILAEHPELAADYRFPRYFFDWFSLLPPFMRLRYPRVFIGPKGAVTPLHVDIWGTHAWLSQLVGRKRWILYPPDQQPLLYDFRVEPDRPDFKRYPNFRQVRGLECTIGPGETVYVPSNWSHWVVSLEPTISLTSNYMGPGCMWRAFSSATGELVIKRAWNASLGRLLPRTRSAQ